MGSSILTWNHSKDDTEGFKMSGWTVRPWVQFYCIFSNDIHFSKWQAKQSETNIIWKDSNCVSGQFQVDNAILPACEGWLITSPGVPSGFSEISTLQQDFSDTVDQNHTLTAQGYHVTQSLWMQST